MDPIHCHVQWHVVSATVAGLALIRCTLYQLYSTWQYLWPRTALHWRDAAGKSIPPGVLIVVTAGSNVVCLCIKTSGTGDIVTDK